MTTFLTQAVFEDLPEWVLSAAIDAEGDLQLFGCKIVHLNPDVLGWFTTDIPCKYLFQSANYDPIYWQDSAVDKE